MPIKVEDDDDRLSRYAALAAVVIDRPKHILPMLAVQRLRPKNLKTKVLHLLARINAAEREAFTCEADEEPAPPQKKKR